MCLSVITKRVVPDDTEVIVWKMFYNTSINSDLASPFRGTSYGNKTNQWIVSKKEWLGHPWEKDSRYMSGFHAYKEKKHAIKNRISPCIVIPVWFRRVTTIGTERYTVDPVVVAEEMWIPYNWKEAAVRT